MRTALATLAAALLLTFAPSALADPPTHSRQPALDVEGLNHACGAAVDSQGDLYASSAAQGKIKVFGPADHETPIGEISNANEPCALALTSKGALYVSEKGTGEVVRYVPTEYPFAGAPSYGPREVIDASGQAKGIAVDPFDDRLYVAEGDHVSAYDSGGNLGADETQEVNCFLCKGGKYKLEFAGEATAEINFEGPASEVKAALEGLAALDPGDISVVNEGTERRHIVTFKGKYAHTDVSLLKCIDLSLEGSGHQCEVVERAKGWGGNVGEGDLTEATGVAAYTYKATSEKRTHYLAVADDADDQLKLFSAPDFKAQQLRRTLDGPAEGEEFGFGLDGAYLAADRGTCPPSGEKACTAGHFFLYDDVNEVIDEFEATGELVSQTPFEFGDGAPTAIAVDRSGGANNGALYATSGAGAGARVLAFGALGAPGRSGPLKAPDSLTLPEACGVGVDAYGNRYVAVGPEIKVYGPSKETLLAKIASGAVCKIAVDGAGDVYALSGKEVVYYKPSSFPPTEGTTYGSATVAAKQGDFKSALDPINAFGLNPANGHLFVTNTAQTIEYGSAAEGSKILKPEFAGGLSLSVRESIAVYGANGHVYIGASVGGGRVYVLNPAGTEILAQVYGAGSPAGSFGAHVEGLAVDQSNGHILAFEPTYKTAEEFEPSGAFVADFGSFVSAIRPYAVAIDNGSKSPNKGTAYLAYDDPTPETFDLSAFGGLEYPPPPGTPPTSTTGGADGFAPGKATLNGTVTPNGSPLEACYFQYLTETEYEEAGETFADAEEAPCAESSEEIGEGSEAVDVHAEIEGLALKTTYRFRLVAESEHGTGEGDAGAFTLSPPALDPKNASPVTYTEATLRGEVDPAGSPTTYHFEYITQADYEAEGFGGPATHSTPPEDLSGEEEGFVSVQAQITGLAEGAPYRFRLLAENGVGAAEAEGPTFETLKPAPVQKCPNDAYRTGRSASLPDCRAYELVSPAQDGGYRPFWGASFATNGNFSTALAAADGESVIFETEGPLPETEGNGVRNGYRAQRETNGWGISLYGPTYIQTSFPSAGGVSADHGYSLWNASGRSGSLNPEEGFKNARYISLPKAGADPTCSPEPAGRFELIGCGSEGTDPEAIGRWISPGAEHVIFTSNTKLEPDAPVGKTAIYDRSPGGFTHVVSLLPDGETSGAPAIYRGVSADGSAVAFSIGETMYVRLDNVETLAVSDGPSTFAGFSHDGNHIFYIDEAINFELPTAPHAGLFVCDLEVGPCVGSGAHEPTEIAEDAIFVNIGADGTRAYFSSTKVLTGGEENESGEVAEAGKDNLYLWEASGNTTRFVAVLAHNDVNSALNEIPNLSRWVLGLDPRPNGNNGTNTGPAMDPSRSTPDGEVVVFESHAPLTGYDSDGHSEVFRYDASEGNLVCTSCGPVGSPPEFDAQLQYEGEDSAIASGLAPITNLSDDGETVFFTSGEPLLPADRNGIADVYEWRNGQLGLISSGRSAFPSVLYAVSASGDDVFFTTREALVPWDDEGSRSIYDARVEGGFPPPTATEACEGEEACLGAPTAPPSLALPPTASLPPETPPKAQQKTRKCPQGKRKVRRAGKVRCVKRHAKKHRSRHRRAVR